MRDPLAGVLCLAMLLPASTTAQQAAAPPAAAPLERPSVAALHRDGPVTIDGRLDDAAWAAASVARGFVQQRPVEGTPAEHATEVRVLYDDQAIYIGARMFDAEPRTIAQQLVRRDDEGNADWFAVG
ncbi:MAG: hypothetical protein OEW77_10545, partial [Gemmatimonadota bacterium]|nr:hypothetical protein [Gemmatimonadota bacterium]